jgi:arsenate reductase
MAEALLRKRAGHVFNAFSAGTQPKDELFGPAVQVMKEIGIDITGNKPKGIREYLGKKHFERVIIVCADAEKKCPTIFGSAKRTFWPLEDPAKAVGSQEEVLAFCRKVRDQLDERIQDWLKKEGID